MSWNKTDAHFYNELVDAIEVRLEVTLQAANPTVYRSTDLKKLVNFIESLGYKVRFDYEVPLRVSKIEAIRGRKRQAFP